MTQIDIAVRRADLELAARQEALRWQGYVRQLPLFLLTAAALAGIGIGIMRGVQSENPAIQVLAVLGYTGFYWFIFTVTRLIQAWFKARRTRRARFGKREEQVVSLELADGLIKFREQRCAVEVPVNRILATYMTKDFVFLESAFLPWLPLGRSAELKAFLAGLRTAGAKKGAAPAEETAPLKSEDEASA